MSNVLPPGKVPLSPAQERMLLKMEPFQSVRYWRKDTLTIRALQHRGLVAESFDGGMILTNAGRAKAMELRDKWAIRDEALRTRLTDAEATTKPLIEALIRVARFLYGQSDRGPAEEILRIRSEVKAINAVLAALMQKKLAEETSRKLWEYRAWATNIALTKDPKALATLEAALESGTHPAPDLTREVLEHLRGVL